MTVTKSAANPGATGREVNSRREILTGCTAFFTASFLVLFMAMPRDVGIYDESLVLTGAMRILAGQIPHRDFYAIYGPAEFYTYALLFKVFGQSVLVERLFSLVIEGLTVASVYGIAALYCRKWIAAMAAMVTLFWLYGLTGLTGPVATLPVTVLNLIASLLILPIFTGPVTRTRMALAGALAGLSALFRYDTGTALLGMHVLLMVIAIYLQPGKMRDKFNLFALTIWPYLLAFAAIVLPPALYFLTKSSIYPLIRDIVIIQGRIYHRNRNIPFPGIHRASLVDLSVYLPIAAVSLSIFALLTPLSQSQRPHSAGDASDRQWKAFLLVFGLLAFAMYFKGIVRVSLLAMYSSLIPSMLLIAVLFHQRAMFPRLLRTCVLLSAAITLLLGGLFVVKQTPIILAPRTVPGRILRVLFFANRPFPGMGATWCKTVNPITRGFCFLPDDGRVNTIEFLASHTLPGQTLFVGLDHNDRVFVNDNMIYFAAQRLPATKWSHFDPGLQNTTEIQQEMIQELDRNAPPYIVLDSEFKSNNEPNDSSKSTGVMLLDNYINTKYRYVKTFDEMTIWQRLPAQP